MSLLKVKKDKRKQYLSNDLRSNANAYTEGNSVREITNLQMTSYNVDEKFITAKFDNIEDDKNAYDTLIEHGYTSDAIVLAIIGDEEDTYCTTFKELEDEYNKDKNKVVAMGLEAINKELLYYVSGVWDSNHAKVINN